MKFSTKFVIFLFVLLIFLAIFLHSFNEITKKQLIEEQRDNENFNSYNTDIYNLSNDQNKDVDCPNLLVNRGDIIFLYNTSLKDDKLVATFKNMDEYQAYVSKQQSEGKNCPLLYLRQEINTQGQEVYRMYTESTMGPTAGIQNPVPAPAFATTLPAQASEPSPTPEIGGSPTPEIGFGGKVPMPPPFLDTVPSWDLHRQPPLYVEGGLPALPMETRPAAPIVAKDATVDTDKRYNQTGINSFDPHGLYVGRFTNVDIEHEKTQNVGPDQLSANAADPNWGGVYYTEKKVREGEYKGNEVQRVIYPQVGFV